MTRKFSEGTAPARDGIKTSRNLTKLGEFLVLIAKDLGSNFLWPENVAKGTAPAQDVQVGPQRYSTRIVMKNRFSSASMSANVFRSCNNFFRKLQIHTFAGKKTRSRSVFSSSRSIHLLFDHFSKILTVTPGQGIPLAGTSEFLIKKSF